MRAVYAASVIIAASMVVSPSSTGAQGRGSLTGSVTTVATNVDLTAEGAVDWEHWDFVTAPTRKARTPQITTYSAVGASANVLTYNNDPRTMSWTDGTPNANAAANRNGLFISGINNGFSFWAPADRTMRTLKVYVGGFQSAGRLTAHLSDGSAMDYVNTTTPSNGQYNANYTLRYSAGSAGHILLVTWVQTSADGNVTLNGAALSTP